MLVISGQIGFMLVLLAYPWLLTLPDQLKASSWRGMGDRL